VSTAESAAEEDELGGLGFLILSLYIDPRAFPDNGPPMCAARPQAPLARVCRSPMNYIYYISGINDGCQVADQCRMAEQIIRTSPELEGDQPAVQPRCHRPANYHPGIELYSYSTCETMERIPPRLYYSLVDWDKMVVLLPLSLNRNKGSALLGLLL
jgi:hypothetical protein